MYRLYHRYRDHGDKKVVELIREVPTFSELCTQYEDLKGKGYDVFGRFILANERGYNMQEYEIKKALNLPKKLPKRYSWQEELHVGTIQGVNILDYGQAPRRRRHRLYAQVGPNQYVPCGRLHQYILDMEDR